MRPMSTLIHLASSSFVCRLSKDSKVLALANAPKGGLGSSGISLASIQEPLSTAAWSKAASPSIAITRARLRERLRSLPGSRRVLWGLGKAAAYSDVPPRREPCRVGLQDPVQSGRA